MKVFNKLVRDRIPQIIAGSGVVAEVRTLTDDEYRIFLEAKLDEEVGEYHRDPSLEELADILEVVYALAGAIGCTKEELLQKYQAKHDQRGGFKADRVRCVHQRCRAPHSHPVRKARGWPQGLWWTEHQSAH